jgi:hypothetical protein
MMSFIPICKGNVCRTDFHDGIVPLLTTITNESKSAEEIKNRPKSDILDDYITFVGAIRVV